MNQIYNEDCFLIFPLIEKKSINMVLVDLPYEQTACEWDKKIDLNEMWKQLNEICKDNCIYVFFTTTKYGNELINSNSSWFRYDIVWEKPNAVGFLNAKKMPMRAHELIYIFSNPKKKNKIYNPQMTEGEPYNRPSKNEICENYKIERKAGNNNTGLRYPRSVLKFQIDRKKIIHPTQKPLELCEWLIKTFSNEGDNVLDFCMGSGSSIVACKNTKRNYIGIEKDKQIYDKAMNRICSNL